jgi:hypothetical protein
MIQYVTATSSGMKVKFSIHVAAARKVEIFW